MKWPLSFSSAAPLAPPDSGAVSLGGLHCSWTASSSHLPPGQTAQVRSGAGRDSPEAHGHRTAALEVLTLYLLVWRGCQGSTCSHVILTPLGISRSLFLKLVMNATPSLSLEDSHYLFVRQPSVFCNVIQPHRLCLYFRRQCKLLFRTSVGKSYLLDSSLSWQPSVQRSF